MVKSQHGDKDGQRLSSSMRRTRPEKSGTDIWQDRLTNDEVITLQQQDELATAAMGGVLSEQAEPGKVTSVLDVGCGTGNWVIEVARTFPQVKHLMGIDVSAPLLAYAQQQALAYQVNSRVQFRKMDALGSLDFPASAFDLINLRFGSNFLRNWEWKGMLSRLRHLSQPGGIVRITEAGPVESTSPVVNRGEQLIRQALSQSGHTLGHSDEDLIRELCFLLAGEGFQQVQHTRYTLEYADGAIGERLLAKYLDHGFQMLRPFLQKWVHISDDLEGLTHQRRQEMSQPAFQARVSLHTVWGITPFVKSPGHRTSAIR